MEQKFKMETMKWENNNPLVWKNPAEETYYLRKRWELRGLDRFLDLGCATGRHALFFAEDGYTVTAYHTKDVTLEELSEKVNDLGLEMKYVQGPLNLLSFDDESFDCLLAYESLHHLRQEDLPQILNEIYRLLKTDGECYITLPEETMLSESLLHKFQVISFKKITSYEVSQKTECYHLLLKK